MHEAVLEQLRLLADNLSDLHGRVRQAVAGKVAKAVAEAVAEVVNSALGGRVIRYGQYSTGAYGRSDWDDPDPHDWHPRDGMRHDSDDDERSFPMPSLVAVLALAIAAGR